MTEKKSNFLPLLLIGGGLAGAALLYGFGTKQSKEDSSLGGAVGVGGSGDFFGNSEGINPIVNPSGGVPMSPTPIIMPMLYPDSTDAGIEDIARDDVNLGLTDPSNGGVNPNNYSSGADIAQELALYAGATAAVSAAGYGAKKAGSALKNAGTKTAKKVATNAAGQVANTATKAAGSTAGKVVGSVAKGAGVLGVLGVVDMLFDVTGLKEAHFSQDGLTGNLQGVNTSYTVNTGGIKTDKATSKEIGNMAYDSRQLKIASGLAGTGSTYESITAEETKIVNEALGTSGDVIKQSYGDGGYSYIAAGGKQLSFSGTDLKTAASTKTTKKTMPSTGNTRRKPASSSNSGSATTASLSKLFGGK